MSTEAGFQKGPKNVYKTERKFGRPLIRKNVDPMEMTNYYYYYYYYYY
jgi:hypothetical protein